jgi:hypothetical protein
MTDYLEAFEIEGLPTLELAYPTSTIDKLTTCIDNEAKTFLVEDFIANTVNYASNIIPLFSDEFLSGKLAEFKSTCWSEENGLYTNYFYEPTDLVTILTSYPHYLSDDELPQFYQAFKDLYEEQTFPDNAEAFDSAVSLLIKKQIFFSVEGKYMHWLEKNSLDLGDYDSETLQNEVANAFDNIVSSEELEINELNLLQVYEFLNVTIPENLDKSVILVIYSDEEKNGFKNELVVSWEDSIIYPSNVITDFEECVDDNKLHFLVDRFTSLAQSSDFDPKTNSLTLTPDLITFGSAQIIVSCKSTTEGIYSSVFNMLVSSIDYPTNYMTLYNSFVPLEVVPVDYYTFQKNGEVWEGTANTFSFDTYIDLKQSYDDVNYQLMKAYASCLYYSAYNDAYDEAALQLQLALCKDNTSGDSWVTNQNSLETLYTEFIVQYLDDIKTQKDGEALNSHGQACLQTYFTFDSLSEPGYDNKLAWADTQQCYLESALSRMNDDIGLTDENKAAFKSEVEQCFIDNFYNNDLMLVPSTVCNIFNTS